MSSGPFVTRVYEADSGDTHFVRQQAESAVLSIAGSPNTIPAGPPTSIFWAKTSRGAKEYGLRPRKLLIRFNNGAEPTGYADCGTLSVVIYSKSVYDSAVIGDAVTYLGAPGTVVGRQREDVYPEV